MSPNSIMTGVLTGRKCHANTDTQAEDGLMMNEAEIRVMHLEAKECLRCH